MTKLKALVLTLTLTIAMAATAGCGAKTEFDPHQYSKLTLIGPNGYAMATVDKDVKFTGANSKLSLEEKENIIYMMAKTEYQITPAENLKNGDIVKITPVIDEQLAKEKKVKPIIREKEVVIEGLDEPKLIIDLFGEDAKFSCSVSISDEKIYANFDRPTSTISEKFLRDNISYDYSRIPVKKGDKVIVSVTFNNEKLLKKGYVLLGEDEHVYEITEQHINEALDRKAEYDKKFNRDYSFK